MSNLQSRIHIASGKSITKIFEKSEANLTLPFSYFRQQHTIEQVWLHQSTNDMLQRINNMLMLYLLFSS